MKITKKELQKLVLNEINNILSESVVPDKPRPERTPYRAVDKPREDLPDEFRDLFMNFDKCASMKESYKKAEALGDEGREEKTKIFKIAKFNGCQWAKDMPEDQRLDEQ